MIDSRKMNGRMFNWAIDLNKFNIKRQLRNDMNGRSIWIEKGSITTSAPVRFNRMLFNSPLTRASSLDFSRRNRARPSTFWLRSSTKTTREISTETERVPSLEREQLSLDIRRMRPFAQSWRANARGNCRARRLCSIFRGCRGPPWFSSSFPAVATVS